MKKANIFRSIFWGFIGLIALALGIVGYIENNRIFSQKKDDLERIVEIFNKNKTILNYETVNASIKASLKGKNIIIKYDGVEQDTYIYKFKLDHLETDIDINDSIGNVILMVVADSISVNKGGFEEDTYPLFKNNTLLNYNLEDGINYKQTKNGYKVKLSLENALKRPFQNNLNTNENDSNN